MWESSVYKEISIAGAIKECKGLRTCTFGQVTTLIEQKEHSMLMYNKLLNYNAITSGI